MRTSDKDIQYILANLKGHLIESKKKTKFDVQSGNVCVLVFDYLHQESKIIQAYSTISQISEAMKNLYDLAPVVQNQLWYANQSSKQHRNHTEPKVFAAAHDRGMFPPKKLEYLTLASDRPCCTQCLKNSIVKIKATAKKMFIRFRVINFNNNVEDVDNQDAVEEMDISFGS